MSMQERYCLDCRVAGKPPKWICPKCGKSLLPVKIEMTRLDGALAQMEKALEETPEQAKLRETYIALARKARGLDDASRRQLISTLSRQWNLSEEEMRDWLESLLTMGD